MNVRLINFFICLVWIGGTIMSDISLRAEDFQYEHYESENVKLNIDPGGGAFET